MTEWWTYRLSDFLMFSPGTYLRLLEQVHADGWPWAQMGSVVLGVALVLCVTQWRDRRWALPLACALLALAWAAAGVGFLWRHYATINWGAPAIAAAFLVQAVLLLAGAWAALLGKGGIAQVLEPPRRARPVGVALLAAGVAGYPLLAPLMGRPWSQAELFALMPDPTVVATLGLLVLGRPGAARGLAAARGRQVLWWVIWPVPLAAAALAGATSWAMDMLAAPLLPAAALVAIWGARRHR